MRFLDPAFLFGLLAIAVPVALHLLFRRRVPIVDFPLVRLIAKAERSRQPRKRLNRVLLLLARALALALLALALARATLGPGTVVAARGPLALVLVVDDSSSMGALSAEGRTAFELGVEEALAVLGSLPEGSLVGLVAASAPERGEAAGLVLEVAEVRARLEALEPTLRHAPVSRALASAARLLDASAQEDRRAILVSDRARHAFEGLRLTRPERSRPMLEVLSPPAAEGVNRSVSGLEAEVLPDGRLGVTARVSAWGRSDEDVSLEVRVGVAGEEARLAGRSTLAPGAGASSERRFELTPPTEGLVAVEAAISPDVLPADDVRHAVHQVTRRLRVLVVDGDPQNLSFGSETFYLDRALAPGVGLDFDAEIVTVPELLPEDFERHDAIVLANVPELSEERAAALTRAVRGGVGLVVALGNRISQPIYNGRLAELLPATVGVLRDPREPARVEPLDSGLELPRVSVRRWHALEPDASARVAASLDAGEPLVVTGTAGEGRVALISTTLDRDWTDLPISPHYLPFLRELIGEVAARHRSRPTPTVSVGRPVAVGELVAGQARLVVTPSGRRTRVPSDGVFRDTTELGTYLVSGDETARGAFAVATDPAESDLTRLSGEEISSLVSEAFEVGEIESAEGTGGGLPAWKALLVLLVGVTAAESWLARRAS